MSTMSSERRRFFRINDTISLSYRLIDEQTAGQGLAGHCMPVVNEHSLAATLDVLSQDALRVLHTLDAGSATTVELFKILDAKINAVAQAVMFVGSNVNAHNTQEVNLSATGLAFRQSAELPIGQHLAIELYLPSTLALMLVYGQVVDCQAVECLKHESYQVRVDFTHIREDDQELLIKHVVRKQWQQLQSSKTQSPPAG